MVTQYADELQLFETSHVQEVLREGSDGTVCQSRKELVFLPSSEICCPLSQTAWNLLFPMSFSKLRTIESTCNNGDDIMKCKRIMLQEWLKDPALKPSWCSLVDALHQVDENIIADDIICNFNVDLAHKLLDPTLESTPIDEDYLQELSEAMGIRWSSFVPLLPLTSNEREQLSGEGQPALAMLRRLREKGPLTYGGLRELLSAIPLLNPTV